MHDCSSIVLPETGVPVKTATLSQQTCSQLTRVGIARCLSSAFSSGIWSTAPMPVGSVDDPDSALGVMHGLGGEAIVIVASRVESSREPNGDAVVGCVLGTVINRRTIRHYGLESYGARPGDGLLAFIGVLPQAQGGRVISRSGKASILTRGPAPVNSPSLARLLFESWIETPRVRRCPRVFVRTRRRLPAIQYLSESCGFELCGKFEVTFRGELQSRLVYRLTNARAEPAARGLGRHRPALEAPAML